MGRDGCPKARREQHDHHQHHQRDAGMPLSQVDVVGDDVEPVEPGTCLADNSAGTHPLELTLLDHPIRHECDSALGPHCVMTEEMMLNVAPRSCDCGCCSFGHSQLPYRLSASAAVMAHI